MALPFSPGSLFRQLNWGHGPVLSLATTGVGATPAGPTLSRVVSCRRSPDENLIRMFAVRRPGARRTPRRWDPDSRADSSQMRSSVAISAVALARSSDRYTIIRSCPRLTEPSEIFSAKRTPVLVLSTIPPARTRPQDTLDCSRGYQVYLCPVAMPSFIVVCPYKNALCSRRLISAVLPAPRQRPSRSRAATSVRCLDRESGRLRP